METVRERLERLKRSGGSWFSPSHPAQQREEPVITPESIFMRKAEKAMNQIETLRKRMLSDTGQYISLFYELKKAEDEFLVIVQEKETKFLDLPDPFLRRMEEVKSKIRRVKAEQ
ncbi:hypothetical protein HZB88_00980 [archaeon]|nr:hypothetical protein [archaeon]